MNKAIGYVRVSSVGGRSGPGYHTLQIQKDSIERTARYRQYQLLDILTDEDWSGKTRERPEFQNAMRRVLDGEADAIIVWKVSRFSRNWREAAEDVETLLDNGKDLLSEEGFDTATAGGRLLLRILFSLANWEHDVLGEHWEIIKAKAVRDRGSFLGNAPLGYRHADGSLEPDPATKELVVELFTRRAAGAPWSELADHLDGLRPRDKGRRDRKDVERIIRNRVYLGEVRWRDQVNERAHVPLVPRELWEQANALHSFDAPRRSTRPRTREFPLTGWLRCSSCGGPMSGSMDRARGQPAPNYKCSRRRGGCQRPQSISALAAEEWALGQLKDAYRHRRFAAVDGESAELTAAVARLGETERALHDLASVQMRRELGDDWLVMVRRLRAEKTEIEREILGLRRNGVPVDSVPWEDMTDPERWRQLRSIAPLGANVGPAVRGRSPADRLSFLFDDAERDSIPGSEDTLGLP